MKVDNPKEYSVEMRDEAGGWEKEGPVTLARPQNLYADY